MGKNVMKLLKPSPHRARNDFDLSHRHVFDANFGELLPATCIETVPGDNITLHASDLLRAIPFVSSPFLRAKQHLDVWFVPYRDLWHQFDAFVTKKSEPVSSAFLGSSFCPLVPIYHLHKAIETRSDNADKDITGRLLSDRSYYLLQLLGYGDLEHYYGTGPSSSNSFHVNPFRLAAYNYIWYNEYRQQYYDDGSRLLPSNTNVASLFNFDDLGCTSIETASLYSRSNPYNVLGAMCQMRYRCWKKDLFSGVLPSTQFGLVSSISAGTLTGLSAAFVGTQATITGNTGNDFNRHNFADSTGTSFSQDTLDLRANMITSGEHPFSMYQTKIVDGNEYLENNVKSPRVGLFDAATPYGDPMGFGGDQIGNLDHVYDTHNHDFSVSYTPQGSVSLSGTSGTLGFDVLSLRKAEALQIWRENALRAGNHIKDNMMAHYGVASDFQDHRPTYLGSVSAPLNISDIAATANSSSGINDTVGDIAGKGLSSLSEKVFKFHAKEFGVIMVMFSLLPEAEYDAFGIERTNQLLEAEDFFVPEFENLGLEAVSSVNLGMANGQPSQAAIYGYAPRYYGYKTKLYKCFGAFAGSSGLFRTWTSQRSDVTAFFNGSAGGPVPLKTLYVDPAIYDANFNVGIANSPQFLCDLYFDVDAVRPMSVVGLPFS